MNGKTPSLNAVMRLIERAAPISAAGVIAGIAAWSAVPIAGTRTAPVPSCVLLVGIAALLRDTAVCFSS
ncbi:MAG: hypothetical protein LBP19_02560 [Treponema sp.]|jgi:hypothetical protein|nr:hypothetical protein [Treponema sp.]